MVAMLKGVQDEVKLGPTTINIGRATDNQLVVNDPQVARHQAQIFIQGSNYVIVDLNSMNHTWVDGTMLSPYTAYQLKNGQKIRFGLNNNNTFIFENNIPQQLFKNGNLATKPFSRSKRMSNWLKFVGGLASLATVFVALWGVYTYVHPSFASPTSTPPSSPSIPRLHPTYTGTMYRDDNRQFNFSIFYLHEDTNGNFQAQANDACPASVQGVISADNSITFNMDETTVTTSTGVRCGYSYTFKGTLNPDDGQLSGTWQGPTTSIRGNWSLS